MLLGTGKPKIVCIDVLLANITMTILCSEQYLHLLIGRFIIKNSVGLVPLKQY